MAVQLSVLGLYLPAGVQIAASLSAPDDHFTASPHCRVTVSGSGRVGGAGGCPTIRVGLYLPPVFRKLPLISAPHNHFAAGPHCRVTVSCIGRVGGAGGCPTIGARIVSARRCSKCRCVMLCPPQTIISLPVHTAV